MVRRLNSMVSYPNHGRCWWLWCKIWVAEPNWGIYHQSDNPFPWAWNVCDLECSSFKTGGRYCIIYNLYYTNWRRKCFRWCGSTTKHYYHACTLISKVVSTHLWNTSLSLYQQAKFAGIPFIVGELRGLLVDFSWNIRVDGSLCLPFVSSSPTPTSPTFPPPPPTYAS